MVAEQGAADEVPPGGIGEGVEHAVGEGVVGEEIYNHLVVD
jgi:hypothetical protein